MKFLFWALVVAVIIAWLVRGKKAPVSSESGRKPDVDVIGEAMICCAHCGIHVPRSESVVANSGTVFCSEEHRRLHAGA